MLFFIFLVFVNSGWSPEILVNSEYSDDNQHRGSITHTKDGYLATFRRYETNSSLYGQFFNYDGTKSGNNFIIKRNMFGYDSGTVWDSIASLKDDQGFIVCYYDADELTVGSFCQFLFPDGSKNGDEFIVNELFQHMAQTHPKVCVLSDGGIVVSWISRVESFFFRIYEPDGSTRVGKTDILSGLSGVQVECLGFEYNRNLDCFDDSFVVTFSSEDLEVYFRRFDNLGNPIDTPATKVTKCAPSCDEIRPVLATFDDGSFVLCTQRNIMSDSYIYSYVFDENGIPLNENGTLVNNPHSPRNYWTPDVVSYNFNGENYFFVVYSTAWMNYGYFLGSQYPATSYSEIYFNEITMKSFTPYYGNPLPTLGRLYKSKLNPNFDDIVGIAVNWMEDSIDKDVYGSTFSGCLGNDGKPTCNSHGECVFFGINVEMYCDCDTGFSSIDDCSSCENGYFAYNNTCFDTCPIGTYPSGQNCEECTIKGCLSCSDGSSCDLCDHEQYFFYNNNCVLNCDIGLFEYVDFSTRECLNCTEIDNQYCLECSIDGKCEKCEIYYLYDGNCVRGCEITGYYEYNDASGYKCVECMQSIPFCLECDDEVTCTNCSSTYYIENGLCVQYCGQGYYLDDDTCLQCLEGCINCVDENECVDCDGDTFFLKNEICVNDCENGWFVDDSECHECESGCVTCLNVDECSQCDDSNLFLEEGVCVSECSDGFDEVNGNCEESEDDLTSNTVYIVVIVAIAVVSAILLVSIILVCGIIVCCVGKKKNTEKSDEIEMVSDPKSEFEKVTEEKESEESSSEE